MLLQTDHVPSGRGIDQPRAHSIGLPACTRLDAVGACQARGAPRATGPGATGAPPTTSL